VVNAIETDVERILPAARNRLPVRLIGPPIGVTHGFAACLFASLFANRIETGSALAGFTLLDDVTSF
jgi:hypothetical protein